MYNANSSGSNAFGGASAGANTNPLGGGLFGGKPLGSGAFGGGGTANPLAPAPSGGLFGSSGNAASATAATPSNMFGSAPTGTAPASGGLFGNAANTNNASNTTTPASTGGLFGNFAGRASTPAGGSAFGAPSSIAQSTGAFGGNNATGSGAAPAPSGGLFGSSAPAPSAGGGLFGSSTPTPAPPSGGLFGSSTPAPAPQAGGGLFGSSTPAPAPQTGGGLFGSMPPPAVPAATGGTNPLLAGFGASKPADQTQSTTPKPAPSNFFGQPAAATPSTSAPAAPPAGGGLFGGGMFKTPTVPSTTPAASTTPAGGLFSNFLGKKPDTPTPSGTATPTLQPTQPALNLGGNKDEQKGPTTAPGATPSNIPSNFFSLGGTKPEEKKDGPAAAAPSLGLFGQKPPANDKKDAVAPSAFSLGGAAINTTSLIPAPLAAAATQPVIGSSTAAASVPVSVPPPSMLRGKTIEEIVNKWSTELEVQVREFNKFASEVAVWDRSLIENGNNLAALYATVVAAEREQSDVDQSLDHIEQQQKELSSTLEAYEKSTDEVLGGQGGTLRAVDTGPADNERDKNYKLATELHGHLDDLSGSLVQMIESVNALSIQPGDDAKDPNDDPMSQIAQILSSHLDSLQWIDGAVKEVEAKVTEVERRVRGVSETTSSISSGGVKSRGFGLGR